MDLLPPLIRTPPHEVDIPKSSPQDYRIPIKRINQDQRHEGPTKLLPRTYTESEKTQCKTESKVNTKLLPKEIKKNNALTEEKKN